MKRKMLLLDFVLLALLVVVGMRLRDKWVDARNRESVALGQPLKQASPPPYERLPEALPLAAADYATVAQHVLWSADRNPTVVIIQPPPPPQPDLPTFYGAFDLGDGPVAILSEKSGSEHKRVRFGEKIGDFTLVKVTRDQIILDWRGEKVVKRLNELAARQSSEQSAAPVAAAAARPPEAPRVNDLSPVTPGPGPDRGDGTRGCKPGDASAAGTVMDGLRKVVISTPFGQSCRWEQSK